MITYRQPFRGEYPITQNYGDKDTSSFHTGIDYACPSGTEILASADGVVMHSDWLNGGWGNSVIILHEAHKATLYAHLSKCIACKNQLVKQGEAIGLSGSTGNSTGPHLHFEARKDWQNYQTHFNPLDLPLMTVDDSILPPSDTERPKTVVPEGVCQIACDAAYVRDWKNVQRQHLIYKGERVYAFADVKFYNGLPYRFIGAGMCVAEFDAYGTQILEKAE